MDKSIGNAKTMTLPSGISIPMQGLGTWALRGEECYRVVKTALSLGVRLIDTASMYQNEKEVGRAINDFIKEGGAKREEIFLITKIYPGEEMERPTKYIEKAFASLKLDYIDMMMLHHPDPNQYKAVDSIGEYIQKGKIRSLGISNFYVSDIDEFLKHSPLFPDLVQNEIHPYYQEIEVVKNIQEKGVAVQAWYPLGGRGHTAKILSEPILLSLASKYHVTPSQVVLKWLEQRNIVSIAGSSSSAHIAQNIDLSSFSLSDDDMRMIATLDRNEKHDWY